jgi:hypothetical protein
VGFVIGPAKDVILGAQHFKTEFRLAAMRGFIRYGKREPIVRIDGRDRLEVGTADGCHKEKC